MTTLRAHQRAAFEFARDRPATMIASCMGAGKSFIAIALADHWRARNTIVLCPTTVRSVWRREIPKHSTREVVAAILDAGSVRSRTGVADTAVRQPKPAVVVINYEAAWREPFRAWSLSRKWDLAILDESQRAQKESKTALYCNDLREVSRRRLCLTGTPLTQDPVSVWAQCRFLDPSLFSHHLRWFRHKYENKYGLVCRKILAELNVLRVSHGKKPLAIPGRFMRGTIRTREYLEKLATITHRVERTVLDLPPFSVEKRTFRLSASARKLYDAFADGHQKEIQSGLWPDVRASFATTMRLQQITSGWLPRKDGTKATVDHGKARCLRDILTECGDEPVVVFTRFIRDLDFTRVIAESLGRCYGEISQRRKDGLTPLGVMPDGLDVVGVQEQAGGAGIDLTRARIIVDYSPSWSLPNYDQKVARVLRPPQDKPVILYQLVAEDSIDEEIHRALVARRAIVDQVWDGLEATVSP